MSTHTSEKSKVQEAERLLAWRLQDWEEKMKKADEAKRVWNVAVGIQNSTRTTPPPFQGAPLSPLFPKTPVNFHNGQPVVVMVTATQEGFNLGGSKEKAGNPFDGVPLSPDFPKTPLRFYRGHVVGEPRVVITDHDVEIALGREGKMGGKWGKDVSGGGDDRWYD